MPDPASNAADPPSPALELALRLWPSIRDEGRVEDPSALDTLLATQGLPGAPGQRCGLRHTFACFPPDVHATFRMPTGERPRSGASGAGGGTRDSLEGDDAEARFIAHLLVTRTLLGAGLTVDERVTGAMHEAHALSWTTVGGTNYRRSPLALAVSLWLIALDPLADSDRPLPIDWSPRCYQERDWWDRDYRLFSHYDVRERALDWSTFIAADRARLEGCSVLTAIEPLLQLERDSRLRIALGQLAAAAEQPAPEAEAVPAAAMLERGRIAALLQGYLRQSGGGSDERGVRVGD